MGINPTPSGANVRAALNITHANGVTFEVTISPASQGSNAQRDAAIESLVTHLDSWADLASGPVYVRIEESVHDVTP